MTSQLRSASLLVLPLGRPQRYGHPVPEPVAAILSPANLATALIALNLLAFAMFGIDKAKAEAGKRRIAESTLLLLAFLGGTPGAYAGRAAFRHKTRKQPFSRELHAVAVMQAAAIGATLGWILAG
jgi:uncharacterized membrane protein YsdA (DUF1294 family)